MSYTRASEEWFYSVGGQPIGPVSAIALEELIRSGTVNLDQMVWHQTWTAWVPIRDAQQQLGFSGTTAQASDTSPAASFQSRLLSWAIDLAVLVVVLTLTNNLVGYTPLASLLMVTFYIVYIALLPGVGFDTLGHQVAGLAVRDGERLEPVGRGVYWARGAMMILLAVPLLVGLVGSIVNVAVSGRQVAWHDAFTGSVVVKRH